MKTYVIHEVSSDNLASHLDTEGSKLLAVIPESFDSSQVSAVLSNVFHNGAKFPSPSSTISKALKFKNGNGTSLSQRLIAGLKSAGGKAMTANDFFSQPEFSDHYNEGQIRKCLYSLAYNKKIRSNGSGKYSAKS